MLSNFNMDELNAVFDIITSDEKPSSSYVADPNMISSYLTKEAYAACNNEIWFDVKWLPNTHPGMLSNTIVHRVGHDFDFSRVMDGQTGLQNIGYKVCGKSLKTDKTKGGKTCPWCSVSYALKEFVDANPTHPKAHIFTEISTQTYRPNSNGYYTNIYVINSNIPEIIGKTFMMKPHGQDWYTEYFNKKLNNTVRGVKQQPINIYNPEFPPTKITVTKDVNSKSKYNTTWSFADVEMGDEYFGKTNAQIYAELGLDFNATAQPFDLKQFSPWYNGTLKDEELANLDLFVSNQYDAAKQWIALNAPEIIPTSTTNWIKAINPAAYMAAGAGAVTSVVGQVMTNQFAPQGYMDPTGGVAPAYGVQSNPVHSQQVQAQQMQSYAAPAAGMEIPGIQPQVHADVDVLSSLLSEGGAAIVEDELPF